MTNQELYDRVKAHLQQQGCKAVSGGYEGESCAYRTENGLKCAIGCLIPDEKYSPDMEGMSIRYVALECVDETIQQKILAAAGIRAEQRRLAAALQGVHDSHPVESWTHELAEVAGKWGLKS